MLQYLLEGVNMEEHYFKYDIESVGDKVFCSIKIKGKLTHGDYEMFVPGLEEALCSCNKPKIKILVDIREIKGWELEAAWDDLKLSLKHGPDFEKIAAIGENMPLEIVSKVSQWFIPYEVKFFDDENSAKEWLFS